MHRTRRVAGLLSVTGLVLAGTVGVASVSSGTPRPQPAPTQAATPAPTPTPTPTPTPPPPAPAPPPAPNNFANPPNPPVRTLAGPPGATLVPVEEVAFVPPRFFVQPPAPRLRDAPRAEAIRNGVRTPIFNAGDNVRLLVDLPLGGQQWTVRLRQQGAGNEYSDLGIILTPDSDLLFGGRAALPVMNFTRKGTYIVAMTNTAGETVYVKIVVGPRQ